MQAHLEVILSVAVYLLMLFTTVRIILDTNSPPKALSYLLLTVTLPVVGSIAYFTLGVNYRKRRIYSKKLKATNKLLLSIRQEFMYETRELIEQDGPQLGGHTDLANLVLNESLEPVSLNRVTLLNNGEEKFPSVIEALESARQFIHIEYYIYEDDEIGNRIKDLLIRKAQEGVTVRFIYDDFGSRGLKSRFLDELKEGGVEAFPFYQILWPFFASRLNYRNHRKIIVVDGKVGFLGGINVSDRYINRKNKEGFWRDIHVRIEGPAVWSLQIPFLADWNFCSGQRVAPSQKLFPVFQENVAGGHDLVQIVAGGPDYPRSGIMLSYFAAITGASDKIYLTSPYFIPNVSIFDALRKAALSGKDVRLLVPGVSDSAFVNAASRSYYQDLLDCGVKIYLYKKGFIHAKSLVVDDDLSIVGTANMDFRSFDLNFEINAVIYGQQFCGQLTQSFLQDLEDSTLITEKTWKRRNKWQMLLDKVARLFSPLL